MKKIIVVILILTAIYSCKKTGNGATYTIKGQIFSNCSKQPYANKVIYFTQYNSSFVAGIGNVTTDSSGHFSFSYVSNYASYIDIRPSSIGAATILKSVPNEKNIDNLQVMVGRPTVRIVLSLNVTKAGLLGDSLIISDFRRGIGGGGMKLPCPLKSGTVYDASNVILSPEMATYTGHEVQAQWMFNSEIGHTTGKTKYFYVTKLCTGDTTNVVLDIN